MAQGDGIGKVVYSKALKIADSVMSFPVLQRWMSKNVSRVDAKGHSCWITK
jgi:isocitrate/isopropylmalate dehydrogenase